MKLILDSSAILSGKFDSTEHEYYTSPNISQELENSDMNEKFNYLLDAGLRIMSPSEDSIRKVRAGAQKTGDINRLSEPDIELLSLALELDGVILTNDYSIQNLASELNIPFLSPTEQEITDRIIWQYQCRGCAQIFEKKVKECPICGSQLRFKPKSMKKVSPT
ncbi:NOB1 family endonuclease [[Eubacterium] cellulosolvens]